MNNYIKIWQTELQQRKQSYSNLLDGVHYLMLGSELMNQLDTSLFPPMIAEMARDIKAYAQELAPCVEQLDAHLNLGCKND